MILKKVKAIPILNVECQLDTIGFILPYVDRTVKSDPAHNQIIGFVLFVQFAWPTNKKSH